MIRQAIKKSFEFALVLSGVSEKTEDLEDALFESGCSDAFVCYRSDGTISVDFIRESSSLKDAVNSAIADIEHSSVNAKVDHIDDVYVSLQRISVLTGIKKQSLSQYYKGERGPGNFPIARGDNRYTCFKWSEVAEWLYNYDHLVNENEVYKAKVLEEIDMELQKRKQEGNISATCIGRNFLNNP